MALRKAKKQKSVHPRKKPAPAPAIHTPSEDDIEDGEEDDTPQQVSEVSGIFVW